jgi:hypothetical protein
VTPKSDIAYKRVAISHSKIFSSSILTKISSIPRYRHTEDSNFNLSTSVEHLIQDHPISTEKNRRKRLRMCYYRYRSYECGHIGNLTPAIQLVQRCASHQPPRFPCSFQQIWTDRYSYTSGNCPGCIMAKLENDRKRDETDKRTNDWVNNQRHRRRR